MKIIIIRLNTSDFGKIGTYNVQEVGLAKSLMKNGNQVTVLFTHRRVKKITQDGTYNFVYYLPHISIGLHGIFKVKMISMFKPEYVILFSDNQLWAKNIIVWCSNNGIKCVNYFGGVLSNNPKWLHQLYTKMILFRNKKAYSKTINYAKTSMVKMEMNRNGIHCDRIINVGVDTDILNNTYSIDYDTRTELSYSIDDKIILFVGRLVEYKNPLFACEIVKRLYEEDQSYKLIIIGKGELQKDIIEYIKINKLQNVINLVGEVNYNLIYKYMVISNCLINLSSIEIFGMTIIEAMYYGISVVAHNAPGPNDMIEEGKNGYLLNSYDVNEWASFVKQAIYKQKYFANNSRQKVKDDYTWDAVCEKFLNNGLIK